jgi:DsbC/DsbD-like thiol-disulfide interchange protein
VLTAGDAAVEIGFPSPMRFDDGYAASAGYDRPVSLALTMKLPEGNAEAHPVRAEIFLGMCETICIPVQATLSFTPGAGGGQPQDEVAVEAAFDALPAPARPGFAAEATAVSDKAITVTATLPEGVRARDLFVAGASGLGLGTPEREGDGGVFRVPVTWRSGDAPLTLPYTLVTDAGAVAGIIDLPPK